MTPNFFVCAYFLQLQIDLDTKVSEISDLQNQLMMSNKMFEDEVSYLLASR